MVVGNMIVSIFFLIKLTVVVLTFQTYRLPQRIFQFSGETMRTTCFKSRSQEHVHENLGFNPLKPNNSYFR